jgi:hypothetical protein
LLHTHFIHASKNNFLMFKWPGTAWGEVGGAECLLAACCTLILFTPQKTTSSCSQGLTLREEKMVVQNISKLAAQRNKLKEYDICKQPLNELEAENQKVGGFA